MIEKEENIDINQKLIYNLILIGNSGVGKTALFKRIVEGKFEEQHLGSMAVAEKLIKNLNLENGKVMMDLIDIPGVERWRNTFDKIYKKSDAALILYDITEKSSFDNIDTWIDYIKYYIEDEETYTYFIAGTKNDLLCENEKIRKVEKNGGLSKCVNKPNMKFIGEINSINLNEEILDLEGILKIIHEKRKDKKLKEKEKEEKEIKDKKAKEILLASQNSPKKYSKKKNKCCEC